VPASVTGKPSPPKAAIIASVRLRHPWPDAPVGYKRCKTLIVRWRLRQDGAITSQVEGIASASGKLLPRDVWPPNLDTADRPELDGKGKPVRLRLSDDDHTYPADRLDDWLVANGAAVDVTPPATGRLTDGP
jgi:hypothetical protein